MLRRAIGPTVVFGLRAARHMARTANVRGDLVADEKGWLLRPAKLVEPGQKHRAGILDPIRIGRECQATTKRYLDRRGLARPVIPWDRYRRIRAALPKS